jgi:F-type H+-transporting ATPase subunit b
LTPIGDGRSTLRRATGFALGLALVSLARPAWAAGDLVLIPDIPLLVALVVLFVLLVLPVNVLVFKPIFRILDEREERTQGTRRRAEKLERDAQEILDRYESSVREVREESERERRGALEGARGESQQATSAARADSEGEIERARSQIAAEYEAARNALRASSQDLARQAASRVLGRAL